MKEKTVEFVNNILNWWETRRRDFPWRHTSDPYKLLVTEILLRKTTAFQVNLIYDKFFENYPTVKDLADADQEDLLDILNPLGMENKRSREFLEIGKFIMDVYEGEIPEDYHSLMEIYGVGRYTASGVLCQAYKKDSAMVDRNVVRVIKRYFHFKSKRKRMRDDPALWEFVENLIPKGQCKQFNLGLIDFASEICTARNPKCSLCEVRNYCSYASEHIS
jgi:A/G-specific adenine glycosylase